MNTDLEEQADQLLRKGGHLREHGILIHPDNRHEFPIGDEAVLDYLANRPKSGRRSTRQKQVVSQEKNYRTIRSTDPSLPE